MLARMSIKKRIFLPSALTLYFVIMLCSMLFIPLAIHLLTKPFFVHPSKPIQNESQLIKELKKDDCFPILKGFSYKYINDFGRPRNVLGKTHSHQGIDIMAERNTPAIAVEDCIIDKIGWDNSGGNRINMVSLDGKRRYYYAHFEKFFSGLSHGIHVKRGSTLGFVGSSGYGPPGSDTGTAPHLHIQIWEKNGNNEHLVNPYSILKWLETNYK